MGGYEARDMNALAQEMFSDEIFGEGVGDVLTTEEAAILDPVVEPTADPVTEPVEPDVPSEVPVSPVEPVVDEVDTTGWEKRYKDLQSHTDKQLAESKSKVKAYENMLNTLAQPEPTAPAQVSSDELSDAVQNAPVDTFNWVMQNRPDMMGAVISGIREAHGNEMGDQAMVAWNQAQIAAQNAQMQDQYQQMLAPQERQKSIVDAMGLIEAKYGEELAPLAQRTAEIIQQDGGPRDWTPDEVASYVEKSFLQAYRESSLNSASKAKGPETTAPVPHVETGTPGTNDEPSFEDEVGDEIVAAFTRSRYS